MNEGLQSGFLAVVLVVQQVTKTRPSNGLPPLEALKMSSLGGNELPDGGQETMRK